ncbi:MAG TPA: hypothetical protein VNW71_13510, partial [Thermoanaerobaculia bacterium]|nr:hypothetical protein [Thermoanaerobaculia bacterium]
RGGEVTLAGPLKVGRAEIVPAAGTRVRTLMAGGVPCGLAVEGPAQLRYPLGHRDAEPVFDASTGPRSPNCPTDG